MSRLAGTFFNRLAQLPGEIYTRVARGQSVGTADRNALLYGIDAWELRDWMLAGTAYNASTATPPGALRYILRQLGRPCTTQDEAKYPIAGNFNPVPQIVGFYRNALSGSFGTDIKVAETVVLGGTERDVNPRVADPLSRVWRWSNLDLRSEELTRLAANQGTVGVRVVYKAGPPARVYLDFDDPRWITRVEQDARGNVAAVFLEYDQVGYDADGREVREEVQEAITKEGFSRVVGGREQLDDAERENALGVCPYVLVRHQRQGNRWAGLHAYAGSEPTIWKIAFAAAQLDESIVAHIWPTTFLTGAGRKPANFTAGKYKLIYVQTEAGIPQPTAEHLVPALDFAGALEHVKHEIAELTQRQPELILGSLKDRSAVSGEVLAKEVKAAEAACLRARAQYESGLIAALQIALSWGIANRVDGFDLGTGAGSKEAADRAYDDGQGPEAFAFAERPALPLTAYDRQQIAAADLAEGNIDLDRVTKLDGIVDRQEQLRILGYDDADAKAIIERMAAQDTLTADEDGTDGTDGGEGRERENE